MKEVNDEVVRACKRGREDMHEKDKPEQQKKSRADSSKIEYPDLEEDFIQNIDEGRVYSLMRELMEEIGLVANPPAPPPPPPPPPVTLPLECSAEVARAFCDSALSSTSCSSKCSDLYSNSVCTEDSAKSAGDYYERAGVVVDYSPQKDFPEFFGAGGVMISDDMFNSCSLNTEYGMWQADDVSSGRTLKAKEIRN